MQRVPMSLGRRGFTMIELLVALVLLGLVSAATYRVLVNNQRLYMAQTARIDLAQNIRAAGNILPAEFRELSASEGDIAALATDSLAIRAFRWLGFICRPPTLGGAFGGVDMIIRGGQLGQPLFFGSRNIDQVRDSLLIYYDGNQASRTDDFWAVGKPIAAPNGQNCPDGTAGQRLVFNINILGQPNINGAITTGAPVRGYERVVYKLYRPAGDTSWYIGFQPQGQTIQPLIGPVLQNGLTFTYFDSTGAVTANRLRVARIDITVRARTAYAVRAGGQAAMRPAVDSIVTSVALRNNRRF